MPPKRPTGRPAGAPPTRTALRTQELMLFSGPVSTAAAALPVTRSPSTSKRTASTHVTSGARHTTQSRSTSQRRHAPASDRAPPEYEALPEHFRAAVCVSPANVSVPAVIGAAGVRVPSPPPPRRPSPPPHGTIAAGAGAPPVASGAGSRVIRLLRDARASVRDPIRPETPMDELAAPSSLSLAGMPARSGPARPLASSSSAASPLARRPGGLESRAQRRLPAGGRLAPMTTPVPASSSASLGATTTTTGAAPHSSEIASSHVRSSPPLAPRDAVEQQRQPGRAGAAAPHHLGLTSSEFAQSYPAAQLAGESGIAQAVDLLLQLKQWLVATLHNTSAPPALDAAAVACLQTTLLHFCEYWPTGTALQRALDHCSAPRAASGAGPSDSDDSAANAGSSASSSGAPSVTTIPLLYAQGALLAASVLLQCFPATSLLAEPISFSATAHTLHTLAEAGLAEWVAQESATLEVLVELLRLLDGDAVAAPAQPRQWMHWILGTVALCCEDAAAADARAGDQSTSQRQRHVDSGRPASRDGALRLRSGGGDEADMIRGGGLADDEAEDRMHSTQRWLPASRRTSASVQLDASLPRRRSGGSSAAAADSIAVGSPLNFARASDTFAAAASPTVDGLCCGADGLEGLTAHLVRLGFLPLLHQITRHAVAQCALSRIDGVDAAAADSAARLLPAAGTLYRCFAQSHGQELHRLGGVRVLADVLSTCAKDAATVEAAARALVKLTYVDSCLQEMQASTDVIAAATHALRCQLSRAHTAGVPDNSIELLVCRLCGVMARVAEGSVTQQDYLVSPAVAQLLTALADRYIAVPGLDDVASEQIEVHGRLPPAPVLQAVVWVLGIASMSPQCPLQLVRSTAPQLVRLLTVLRATPNMHLTAVYVLMCLSNVSFFFGACEAVEREPGGASDWLASLYTALGLQLAHYLFEDNVEATVEATRVLGNLSYTNAGRDWMEANKCDEVVVLFLGHEDLRIVYNCCGVLLNLTAASPCRVVQEAELLQLMLSYTSRYTGEEKVKAAAALDEARRRQQQQQQRQQLDAVVEAELAAATVDTESDGGSSSSGSGAAQIADVVEKLLLNIHSLLALPPPSMHSEGDRGGAETSRS
ncbi:hypothetical protein NESM_000201800 [Novymonas esmeraldas]|uniref:Wings apart-like protein C-terminal domain-containing protein n=1 Tax=Novymonas esmeraldas TaxID=1808958 RepID=A0AAW0F8Z3_9TRYP